MITNIDDQYVNLAKKIINEGTFKTNERTGKRVKYVVGEMLKFNLSSGKFPLLTTKKMAYKSMIGELLGFIRGVDNAKDFRELGCKFWDANANKTEGWLNNPNRKGEDDLGEIYGVQAREWKTGKFANPQEIFSQSDYMQKYSNPLDALYAYYVEGINSESLIDDNESLLNSYENIKNYKIFSLFPHNYSLVEVDGELQFVKINDNFEIVIDQLHVVISKILNNPSDRRMIVTHWNPARLDHMALPPCHVMYTFTVRGEYLDLSILQRSVDLPLGLPMNIASYSLLLALMAKITGLKAGEYTHFMHDVHIYEDQIDGVMEQIQREPKGLPTLEINEKIKTLKDIESWVKVEDFKIKNYNSHPKINFPFSE